MMRVRYDEARIRRRPENPDQREPRVRRHERRPDPIGAWMMRMPVEAMVDAVNEGIDRGRGLVRDAIAAIARRLPAGPFSTLTGER